MLKLAMRDQILRRQVEVKREFDAMVSKINALRKEANDLEGELQHRVGAVQMCELLIGDFDALAKGERDVADAKPASNGAAIVVGLAQKPVAETSTEEAKPG